MVLCILLFTILTVNAVELDENIPGLTSRFNVFSFMFSTLSNDRDGFCLFEYNDRYECYTATQSECSNPSRGDPGRFFLYYNNCRVTRDMRNGEFNLINWLPPSAPVVPEPVYVYCLLPPGTYSDRYYDCYYMQEGECQHKKFNLNQESQCVDEMIENNFELLPIMGSCLLQLKPTMYGCIQSSSVACPSENFFRSDINMVECDAEADKLNEPFKINAWVFDRFECLERSVFKTEILNPNVYLSESTCKEQLKLSTEDIIWIYDNNLGECKDIRLVNTLVSNLSFKTKLQCENNIMNLPTYQQFNVWIHDNNECKEVILLENLDAENIFNSESKCLDSFYSKGWIIENNECFYVSIPITDDKTNVYPNKEFCELYIKRGEIDFCSVSSSVICLNNKLRSDSILPEPSLSIQEIFSDPVVVISIIVVMIFIGIFLMFTYK